jgi:hypothetical protein
MRPPRGALVRRVWNGVNAAIAVRAVVVAIAECAVVAACYCSACCRCSVSLQGVLLLRRAVTVRAVIAACHCSVCCHCGVLLQCVLPLRRAIAECAVVAACYCSACCRCSVSLQGVLSLQRVVAGCAVIAACCYSACCHCSVLLQGVLPLRRAIAVRAVARAQVTRNSTPCGGCNSKPLRSVRIDKPREMARLQQHFSQWHASLRVQRCVHDAHQDASQCVGWCGIWGIELRRAWPCTPARRSGAGSNIPSMKSTGNVFGLRNARRPPELISPSRRCT